MDYFTAEETQQFEDAVYDRASEKINPAIEKAENAAKAATDAAAEIPGQIAGKLDKPAAQPVVGQILKVQKINPDGTFVVAWADDGGGTISDVQINGATIVQDGVADIPVGNAYGKLGLHAFTPVDGIIPRKADGSAYIYNENTWITARRYPCAIRNIDLDFAVKTAMCDGKGRSWTAEEQAAARDRIGVGGYFTKITETTITEEIAEFTAEILNGASEIILTVELPSPAKNFRIMPLITTDNEQNFYNIGGRWIPEDRRYFEIRIDVRRKTSILLSSQYISSRVSLSADSYSTINRYITRNSSGANKSDAFYAANAITAIKISLPETSLNGAKIMLMGRN